MTEEIRCDCPAPPLHPTSSFLQKGHDSPIMYMSKIDFLAEAASLMILLA